MDEDLVEGQKMLQLCRLLEHALRDPSLLLEAHQLHLYADEEEKKEKQIKTKVSRIDRYIVLDHDELSI